MTASRDPDRLIHAFLNEGLDELPDPVYDAVRDGIEQTRQRVVIGPWRTPVMNGPLKIGLAAAAAVVVAFVGFQALSGGPAPGTGPSVAPSATASITAEPSPTVDAGLPVGSAYDLLSDGDVRIVVTIPALGWFDEGGLIKDHSGGDPPDGAGMLAFSNRYYTVPTDPCGWASSMPDATVERTFDETVTRLAAQLSRDATAPVDVTVGGYPAKSVVLHVPNDAALHGCDQHQFCTLTNPLVARTDACMRYAQAPGQIEELWIVDVNGLWAIIDAAYYEGTPAAHVEEMRSIVESATLTISN